MCPGKRCESKLGIFSFDGQKCQTCTQMVAPAFQFFRSKLIVRKVTEQPRTCLEIKPKADMT